jgi:Uma2 family endonuclease
MSTAPRENAKEQRFVLHNLDWPSYQAIAKALNGHHVRLTYDHGRLEFMTISHGHERCSNLLGRLVETLTEELDIPLQSGGSTTFGREDLDRALEPDQCYYIQHEPAVRDKDEIDLDVDPPPDLAVEIDISRSSLNRLGIYAAMPVPEVWRFDGEKLRVYLLQSDGSYDESSKSSIFPFLQITAVETFLKRRYEMNETQLVRAFRKWVREQIDCNWQSGT